MDEHDRLVDEGGTAPDEENRQQQQQQQPPRPRTVPLGVFVATLIFFNVVLLGQALSLGAWRWSLSPAAAETGLDPSWRLPDPRAAVDAERLVNTAELALDTDFARAPRGSRVNATVREFDLEVALGWGAPDGFYRPMILVNGQSPGPLIEANTGDTVRVRVRNRLPGASTSIHWHGIDQRNSTWMDGVAGVSQCGIPPGASFTYEFRLAGQRGTFWYHAHESVQYSDGLYGPLVVHDPDERVPETDGESIVFLGDHYHTFGSALVDSYLRPGSKWSPDEAGVEPLPDNFLINGQHTYNCSVDSSTYPPPSSQRGPSSPPPCTGGRLATTRVRRGGTTRLRLINHSSFMSFWFSVDNHTLSVVELDGVEVEPLAGQRGVYLNVGQRCSVVLRADALPSGHDNNQTSAAFRMRATLPQTCFVPYCPYVSAGLESIGYQATALLVYDDGGRSHVHHSDPPPPLQGEQILGTAGNTSNPFGVANNLARGDVWEGCDDMPFDLPVPVRWRRAVEVSPRNVHTVAFQFRQVGEVNRIFINRTSWTPYRDDAQLWQAIGQDFSPARANSYNSWGFRLDQQVLLVPDADEGVQIAINSLDIMEHPFHMHFQIVGWGPGEFGGGAKTTWNLENPMRRDTVTVPAQSHIVLRFVADNPGVWALHCHVAWHMEGGMFVSFIEAPRRLEHLVNNTMSPAVRRLSQSFCAARRGKEGRKGEAEVSPPGRLRGRVGGGA